MILQKGQIMQKYNLSYKMVNYLVEQNLIQKVSMKSWSLNEDYFKTFDSEKFRKDFHNRRITNMLQTKSQKFLTRKDICLKYSLSHEMFYFLVHQDLIIKKSFCNWELNEEYFKTFDSEKFKKDFYALLEFSRIKQTRKYFLKKYNLTKSMFYRLVESGHIIKLSNQKWFFDEDYFKTFDSEKFRKDFYAELRESASAKGKQRFLDTDFRDYHSRRTSEGTAQAFLEHGEDIVRKSYETKKKNNTFTKSKSEEASYTFLLSRFSKDDIIRQYKTEKYPFNCDFYIKSLDLYIECNYSHYHYYCAFDKANVEHQKALELLKEKHQKRSAITGKNTQYGTIIYVWSNLDVRKRQIAKENHLNWVAFYSINDLKAFFKV